MRDVSLVSGHIVWIVGPEGGWSEKEISLLDRQNICKVRMGSLTMTTRVAAVSGFAALLAGLKYW